MIGGCRLTAISTMADAVRRANTATNGARRKTEMTVGTFANENEWLSWRSSRSIGNSSASASSAMTPTVSHHASGRG